MERLISAIATDDGVSFIDRHFGDARFYDVYEITKNNTTFIKRIENQTDEEEEEDGHGNPQKAHSIAGILLEEGVSVVISKVYGPNIKRIRKKFLCVVNKKGEIKESLEKLHCIFPKLSTEISKSDKNIIYL